MPLTRLYGLGIASEISLTWSGAPMDAAGEPDIHIRLAAVPEAGLPGDDTIHAGALCQHRQELAWLQVPGIARFMMRAGRELLVDPAADVDGDSLRLFMLENALPVLLMQRGLLVLRACVVARDGRALAIGGAHGIGKSTLAAQLVKQHGYQPVSDNLCVLTAEGQVLPGAALLGLWPHSIDALGLDAAELRPARPQINKRLWPGAAAAPASPLPLTTLITLQTDHIEQPAGQQLKGMSRLPQLGTLLHPARPSAATDQGLIAPQTMASTFRNLRQHRVIRPRGKAHLARLPELGVFAARLHQEAAT